MSNGTLIERGEFVTMTDPDLGVALIDRDTVTAKLEEMTAAVAQLLRADFGEHSPANDPWSNAIDALRDAAGVMAR